MSNQLANIFAFVLLALVLVLGLTSLINDSATMDELAHIPAGYSYIIKKDMRLNPEHPPLLKDLAGLGAWLGSKIGQYSINFPDNAKAWQEDINGQWDFGRIFLYQSNNPADKIIFASRLPLLLVMLLFGFFVFKWAKELYGPSAGLLALFFFSLSPTILAHGRLVTTDLGAAAAFFIATYYLIKWLEQPGKKNLVKAGLVFGLALLTKFSLALLIPYFIVLTISWSLIKTSSAKLKNLLIKTTGLFLIGLTGLALVYLVYLFHTWHYPLDKQIQETKFILSSFGNRPLAQAVIWLSSHYLFRPLGHFFLGLLMVIQRATGGNTTYFLNQVSAAGWWYYFPLVFLIKVPLAFLLFILLSIFSIFYWIQKPFQSVCQWTKDHFKELAFLFFVALYWLISIRSNLNIGIRHILPSLPFIYLLISQPINKLQEKHSLLRYLIIILLVWYGSSTLAVYPHFLAYFNQLAGGPQGGYQYVVDSNLDWGQDLKRLSQFVEQEKIDKIYLDYFGGGSAEYYLGEKYQPWSGLWPPSQLKKGNYLAVSATLLQGGRGLPAPGYTSPTGYYNWLDQYEPIKRIGYSIFVYQIK